MSNRRVLVGGLALWLAVVTVGSVLVWAVISRVGEHLASSEEPLVTPSTAAAATTDPGSSAKPRPGHRGHPGHPTSTPTGDDAPTPPPTSPATTTTSAPAAPTGRATPRGPSPSHHTGGSSGGQSSGGDDHHGSGSSSSPSSNPTPTAQRRTWAGRAGMVTAQCVGSSVSLVAAQPSSGYSVEVDNRGPARLEVRFEGRSEGQEGKADVRASCSGGVPVFSVSSDDGGEGGDG